MTETVVSDKDSKNEKADLAFTDKVIFS